MNVTSYNKATLDTLLAGKATPAQITAAITQLRTDLLAGAPGALDTLNELAAALGNDQNYAATITTALNARPTAVQVAATYVAVQPTAPDPTKITAWVDKTTSPPTVKGWNGTAWVAIGGGGGGGAVSSVAGRTGAVTLTAADVALGNVNNTSDAAKPISSAQAAVNAAKADLVGGLVPTSQIPALALNTSVTVASQAAMLALTTAQVQPGDLAIRTDGAGTFILTATDPTQLGNWARLNAPTDVVTSVNSQTGTVVLAKGDVGLGSVDNTADTAKPVSTAQSAAIALKLDAFTAPVTLTTTGTLTANVQNLLDATAGAFTATLPTPTKIGQLLVVERADAGTNLITIGGTVRGVTNNSPTLPGLSVAGESITFAAESLTSWRPIASHKPKALLDKQFAGFTSPAFLGTPTIAGSPVVKQSDIDATAIQASDVQYDGTTSVAQRIADLLTRVARLESVALINTAAPVVTGTGTIGQVLTTTTGSWTNSPTSYTYQWTRAGAAISGATSSTYTLVSGDGATSVGCTVTPVRTGYNGYPASSNTIAVAAPTAPVTDDFAGTFSTTKWPNSQGTTVNTGGRLRIIPTASYPQAATADVFDLSQYPIWCQLPQMPNQGNGGIETKFFLSNSNYTNTVYFDAQWPAGQSPYYWTNGNGLTSVSGATTTPISTAGTWMRFRISGANLLYEAATTFGTWTTLRTVVAPAWMTGGTLIRAGLTSYFTGTEPAPGYAEFDNFNV